MVDDADVLVEFDKYPANHGILLRTSIPIAPEGAMANEGIDVS